MEVFKTRVAGVDVHKEILAITVVIGEPESKPQEIQFACNTFSEDLMACGIKLLELGVKDVAMESTGVFWKPIYNIWAPMGIRITLGQAAHMRIVPGRKTDMSDSRWIAELHRYGLIKASYIPDDVFQRMRLLSRHRSNLVEDLSRVKNRVQQEIPGIDEVLAIGVLAEATADMSRFEDERKFAAWSGVAAGNNESAGKKKDQSEDGATPISH